MGIYLFKTEALTDILEQNAFDDFGAQVIPHALTNHWFYGYGFEGYWQDIGTIRSFYETNLSLAEPALHLYEASKPIYSNGAFSRYNRCRLQDQDVLLSEGGLIETVNHPLCNGVRAQIGKAV